MQTLLVVTAVSAAQAASAKHFSVSSLLHAETLMISTPSGDLFALNAVQAHAQASALLIGGDVVLSGTPLAEEEAEHLAAVLLGHADRLQCADLPKSDELDRAAMHCRTAFSAPLAVVI